MASSEAVGTNLASHAEKGLELHIGVAVGASDGSAAAEIVLHERAHDAIFEVDDVMRKIEVLRDAFGVVDIVE